MNRSNYISLILSLLKRQSVSRAIYVVVFIAMPCVLAIVFFIYMKLSLDMEKYLKSMEESFFGFRSAVSLQFDKQNIRYMPFFISQLKKMKVSHSTVHGFLLDTRNKQLFLLDKDMKKVKQNVVIIAYDDAFFKSKFLKNIKGVLTQTLYDQFKHKNIEYLKSGKNVLLDFASFDKIDVGFINTKPILILEKTIFDTLNVDVTPRIIDIDNISEKQINEIFIRFQRYYPNASSMPEIRKANNQKGYVEVKNIFKTLGVLKTTLTVVLVSLIYLVIIACVNVLKELKEKQFQILKNIGVTTTEIVIAFLILEIFFVIVSFIFGVGAFYLIFQDSGQNIIMPLIIKESTLLLKMMLFALIISIIYLWRLFRYEKFD